MATKKKKDALAKTNLRGIGQSLTEFAKQGEGHGDTLVQAALEKFRSDEKAALVSKVNTLVNHIRQLQAARGKTDSEIALFESRLQQVHDGQFTIDASGLIRFKDGFYI